MESNQVKARRAIDIAERKISENDYIGAKEFVNKAQNLYPKLNGLNQVSIVIDVYISATNKNKGEGESYWYGILRVDPLADYETVKKQYKKLALLLHPDKNKCKGAEGAFKLVLEAWSLLSEKAERTDYDQIRKWENVIFRKKKKKPKKPHKPVFYRPRRNKPPPVPVPVMDPSKDERFWSMCNSCKTQCQLMRDLDLNKDISCANCGQTFIAIPRKLYRQVL